MKTCAVYIIANKLGGSIYIGVTNNLKRRIAEHRLGSEATFQYNLGKKCQIKAEN